MSEQLAPFKEYWSIYGGTRALLHSVYFYASIIITALCFPIWMSKDWWDLAILLLPSLIGFLIGTFGLMLAFGSDYFKSLMALATGNKIHSALDIASANFCHFLVVQFAAFLVALLSKSFWAMVPVESADSGVGWFFLGLWGIGFFLLIYSVACALASVMAIFRIARQITIVENVKRMSPDKQQ